MTLRLHSASRAGRAAGSWLLLLASASAPACSPPRPPFSGADARAHVNVLAGTIGSRPVGTDANRRAREYLIDQLRRSGFEVRVQEADAVRPERGMTARVANIIATKAGARLDAIALVAHYDSPPDSPGAADDGLGVAVCLEAGRVLAARPDAAHTLVVALTDAEEIGLMGAAALVHDPVMRQVRAYLNFEAVGNAGPSLLFETGPGHGWLVGAWARHAPEPAGASFASEIYRRLPNDTDFTVLKRAGIPGLNFAPIGDSYAYHTARDQPDRLSPATIHQTGVNTVAIVEALDRLDLDREPLDEAFYFDVMRRTAFSFGPFAATVLAWLAVAAGLVAWIRVLVGAGRAHGLVALALSGVWMLLLTATTILSMLGATWALRDVREVYHPWYAFPGRFFALLVISALVGGWLIAQLRRVLPRVLFGVADPAVTWLLALPGWMALAMISWVVAPAASFLAAIPLVAAGVMLAAIPPRRAVALRVASIVVLAVSWTLWLPSARDLLAFSVPMFGRLPIITPVWVYPALLTLVGIYLVPPLAAAVAGWRHRPFVRRFIAGVLLLAFAVAAGLAYAAPGYTETRPLRRAVRYIQNRSSGQAYWEVGANEPGLDLPRQVPGTENWQVVARDAPPLGLRVGPLGLPFTFRARTSVLAAAPADVRGMVAPDGADTKLEVSVFPREPGLAVVFAMPRNVVPTDANLAGTVRDGVWHAIYMAPPADGVAFRGRFAGDQTAALSGAEVVILAAGLPDGEGWQRLPAWLPLADRVWTARSYYILPAVPRAPGTSPLP